MLNSTAHFLIQEKGVKNVRLLPAIDTVSNVEKEEEP